MVKLLIDLKKLYDIICLTFIDIKPLDYTLHTFFIYMHAVKVFVIKS